MQTISWSVSIHPFRWRILEKEKGRKVAHATTEQEIEKDWRTLNENIPLLLKAGLFRGDELDEDQFEKLVLIASLLVGDDINPVYAPLEGVICPGDHLAIHRTAKGGYFHHGIYLGEAKVAHYFAGGEKNKIETRVSPWEDFVGESKFICLVSHPWQLDAELVVHNTARLVEKYKNKSYRLIWRNCEHFAGYCATGRSYSRQVAAKLSSTMTATIDIDGRTIHPEITPGHFNKKFKKPGEEMAPFRLDKIQLVDEFRPRSPAHNYHLEGWIERQVKPPDVNFADLISPGVTQAGLLFLLIAEKKRLREQALGAAVAKYQKQYKNHNSTTCMRHLLGDCIGLCDIFHAAGVALSQPGVTFRCSECDATLSLDSYGLCPSLTCPEGGLDLCSTCHDKHHNNDEENSA